MKKFNIYLTVFIAIIFLSQFYGCDKKNDITGPSSLTDDDYLKNIVSTGYDNDLQNEDNLLAQDFNDLNDGGAVWDDDNNPGNSPLDSLKRWGRKIISVNLNLNITPSGDTLRNVVIARTINGVFIIIGWKNGQIDSVTKPYTEVLKRNATFKRIAYTSHPMYNWRLYKISMLDGETTQPQTGSSKIQILKIEFYQNNNLLYTFNGPDFSNQNIFLTKRFGGNGIPVLDRNVPLYVKVYTKSFEQKADIVAWHWARNTFGFHRVPFTLLSQTGGSGYYERVYGKYVAAYGMHLLGVFNGYISASTYESLWDDEVNKFASSIAGIPYRVTH